MSHKLLLTTTLTACLSLVNLSANTELSTPPEKIVEVAKKAPTNDVVTFILNNSNKESKDQFAKEGFDLSNEEEVTQLLNNENYIEVLKRVWGEKNLAKRIEFLEKAANDGHAVMMFEYSSEAFKQDPNLDVFINTTQPWLFSGVLRTQQDLTTVNDISAMSAPQKLMDTYILEIQPVLMNHFSQEELQEFFEENAEKINENVHNNLKKTLTHKLPSPKWISSYGNKAAEGNSALIPQDQWDAQRKKFAERLLQEQ